MGWAVFPPCCLVWGQTMVGVKMGDGDLLPEDLCRYCCIQCPWPCSRPLLTHASAKDSWTLTGKSGSYQHNWFYICYHLLDFPGGLDSKASAYNMGDPGSIPGWEDTLEKEMATHSTTFARRIPWMEEPGRLQSMGSQRVEHDWATSLHFTSRSCRIEVLTAVSNGGLVSHLLLCLGLKYQKQPSSSSGDTLATL